MIKMKKIVILCGILICTSFFVQAQYNVHWSKIRHEVFLGAGSINFFGELGGANTIGSHFVKDFDLQSSRFLFEGGYSYKLSEAWAARATIFYGRVYGNDSYTEEYHRHSRNLSFRSPIVELSATIDFSIVREKYGHRYDLRRVKGQSNRPNFYIFTGVSAIYFNPKARYLDGTWYELQPLGTEGQGIISTREKYKRVTLAIPAGLGLNFIIDRNLGIGFEAGVRYTFTDYVDDVSNTYIDPALFTDPIAAFFSCGTANPDWIGTGPGQQRGQNQYNDAFIFLTLKVSYKLRPPAPGKAKF